MIKVREAVHAASKYFDDLYDSDYSNLALEEVEFEDSQKQWLITLGFDVEMAIKFPFPTEKQVRKYKIFEVDAETAEVKSMKIREL